MNGQNKLAYHAAALVTVIVWGVTFVSTKVLLREGISPEEIMLIRFVIAYVVLWALYPRIRWGATRRDELIFAGLGVTSGSLYFLFENKALVYTSAANVSLLCALIPLLTAFLTYIILKGDPPGKRFYAGSAIAIAGVALVVLNGNFVLQLNPLGDFFAFMAIVTWSFYGVLVKCLKGNYNSLLITRKIFFYGGVTILPCFIFHPFDIPVTTLLKPVVLGNICFLSIIASSLCYALWNCSLIHIGTVKANNYLYFQPLVTIVTANIALSEPVTAFVICGTVLILGGLWIAMSAVSLFNRKRII